RNRGIAATLRRARDLGCEARRRVELDADAGRHRITGKDRTVLTDQRKARRGSAAESGKERFESGRLDRYLDDALEVAGVIDAPHADGKNAAGRCLGGENLAYEKGRVG